MKRWTGYLAACCLVIGASAGAAAPLEPASPPPQPRFDQLHHNDAIIEAFKGYRAAYPEWVQLDTIGKSSMGRDIWLMTITNPRTGPASSKPAMYVDGSTHGNEVQGAEATLYLVDYLLSNYGVLKDVTELVDRVTFYVVPIVNVDSRAKWFDEPATAHYPRTVQWPVDDDRDGAVDEDSYDDLDGDGVIAMMRKRVPLGQGTHRLDPDDPRLLIEADADHPGDYVELGYEGIDNDGDGRVNEDTPGYIDPNRSWGYSWQPRYVQAGAGDYPLQIPETRAIALWAIDHPNVAVLQSFHNSGGMILRGPGAQSDPPILPGDLKVYDRLAAVGERQLPGYRYLVMWKDLYRVHGDTASHFYRIHGAYGFTNEMYRGGQDVDGDGEVTEKELLEFNDRLAFGRQFIDWHEVDHPQYGTIEVGGWRHDTGRVPEGWMLAEELHRNVAFVLFNAQQLPKLRLGEAKVEQLGRRTWRVAVPVINERLLPTMSAEAVAKKLHRPDVATLSGAKVVAAGVASDPLLGLVRFQDHRPERLLVDGIPGAGSKTLVFIVEGRGGSDASLRQPQGGHGGGRGAPEGALRTVVRDAAARPLA